MFIIKYTEKYSVDFSLIPLRPEQSLISSLKQRDKALCSTVLKASD